MLFHRLKKIDTKQQAPDEDSSLQIKAPNETNVFIVDGMFLLCSLIKTCPTYETLARKLLLHALKQATRRVDFCFDVYESPSIKDIERVGRGNEDLHRIFSIGGKQNIEGNIDELHFKATRKNCSVS